MNARTLVPHAFGTSSILRETLWNTLGSAGSEANVRETPDQLRQLGLRGCGYIWVSRAGQVEPHEALLLKVTPA